jgi:hypothetical protein
VVEREAVTTAAGAIPYDVDLEESARVPRPRSMRPEELGFRPQKPVPWLSPGLLLRTGIRSGLAEVFGAYLDKRELQNALPSDTYRDHAEADELWLDYIADLGDGFNPTYTMAYLLAQPSLTVAGQALPRGQVLIMGGDSVYPTASGQGYEDRCKGPYTAAMPLPPPDQPQPKLYALPGNHDWYDGLTAFLRLFVRMAHGNLGGWRTEQSRSYFAIQLPRRWWLFALDEQFGAYLDDPQLLYFQEVARQLQPGDKVIICPPSPSWVTATTDHPRDYDNLEFFLRTVIRPAKVDVKLMISGDLHHYARYADDHRQLITAGSGGAYLAATHHLPRKIQVPPPKLISRKKTTKHEYGLKARYPTRMRSRRYSVGIFARLAWRNPGFVGLLGTLHAMLLLAGTAATVKTGFVERRLITIPVVFMAVVMLGLTLFLALSPASGRTRKRHYVFGSLHGVAHLVLAAGGTWVWLQTPMSTWPFPWSIVAAFFIYGPIAGVVASYLVAFYLLIAGAFQVNLNELFAAQGIIHSKLFLRLHFAADGSLTIYPIAVDRVCSRWRATPNAEPHKPWLEPKKPIRVKLAESPIVIS